MNLDKNNSNAWDKYAKKSKTSLWIVSIFSVFLIWLSFGRNVQTIFSVQFESLGGAIVLGFIFFLYFLWFIYDTYILETEFNVKDSVKYNLTKNHAVHAICFYWFVFICLPIIFLLL
jgi:hypothetical protein